MHKRGGLLSFPIYFPAVFVLYLILIFIVIFYFFFHAGASPPQLQTHTIEMNHVLPALLEQTSDGKKMSEHLKVQPITPQTEEILKKELETIETVYKKQGALVLDYETSNDKTIPQDQAILKSFNQETIGKTVLLTETGESLTITFIHIWIEETNEEDNDQEFEHTGGPD